MHLSSKMENWLSEREHKIERDGNFIFFQFSKQFSLTKGEARQLIHSWDAKRRGIPEGKSRKF